ncbi:ABC transporter permease [Paenibacillus campinasensis]|uniref:ABC transporter permease n=1 Tax=Paenibacillus campinasensis TaxID=66347 RepID=A0A268EN05_9BACL|nr:ABC transporter permease [Paenibacillus campinasensis]PAD74506.1 ABC transporter permease [Paenibacillus campinasensis]
MKIRILRKDFSRNKIITATLFVFIMLAAMLVSGAAHIVVTLFGSIDSLFTRSHAPHYVQMHAGELNQADIDAFASSNELVKDHQTVSMLGINGAYIYLGDNELSEAGSIVENSFVMQNHAFDYLLDTDSSIVQMEDGEIGVPIYHMKQYDLELGDSVRIVKDDFSKEFTIAAFVRDVQMNPSIVTSKRFLVSDNDWTALRDHMGEIEYLIEFRLHDPDRVHEFEAMYQASGLPQKDTALTYSLYQLLNGITDGIAAAVIMLISLLLIAIAALCLRFTLTATIEEDYREIGVMKAIGISSRDIRSLYMVKYVLLAVLASLSGWLISRLLGHLFTQNIALYMGLAPASVWNHIVPALGALLVGSAVVLYCRFVLRRFGRISAVEALREGVLQTGERGRQAFRLSRSSLGNVNLFLGIKAVFSRFSMYGVLCFVFTLCAFLMIVPFNFLNTIQSPDFVSYMGAGRSDIRIDLQQGEEMEQRFNQIDGYLRQDADVTKYASFVTAAYQAENAEGTYENIKVELGDFSVFPLQYVNGTAPATEDEIALSTMNAEELGKSVGDTLTVLAGEQERTLTVTGVYQDVTNGGKTAKGLLPYAPDQILWYVVNLEVADGVSVPDKIEEYHAAFSAVKITDMDDYVSQTLGGLIDQLSLSVVLAYGLGIAISILITAMFFHMLIAKEGAQIAIMRSLGLTAADLRVQYITRAMLVLLIGVVLGTAAAVTLGQGLAGALIPGISSMRFIIHPLASFIVSPLLLVAAVTGTMLCVSMSMNKQKLTLTAQ